MGNPNFENPLSVDHEIILFRFVYPYLCLLRTKLTTLTLLEQIKLTLLHSERPKLYAILAFLSAIGLMTD